jgi:hypothetical protein
MTRKDSDATRLVNANERAVSTCQPWLRQVRRSAKAHDRFRPQLQVVTLQGTSRKALDDVVTRLHGLDQLSAGA